jgi:hypothetical protein
MDDDTAACIAAIEVTGTTCKVKFWDKRAALEKLMKHMGMFVERVELGRPGEFSHMTDEELEQFIRAHMPAAFPALPARDPTRNMLGRTR